MSLARFARLYTRVDQTNKTNAKVEALVDYFREAEDAEKLWALALLSGKRPRRTVNTTLLREWAAEESALPHWLFEETYSVVGDLAETIARVLPPPQYHTDRSLGDWMELLRQLADFSETGKRDAVVDAWWQLDETGRLVFNKLITGGFRVGVSQRLVTRALAQYTGYEANVLAHRLMGNWSPYRYTYQQLIDAEQHDDDLARPYPFFLAHPVEDATGEWGRPSAWLVEYKWDGIRAQLIKRKGQWFLWSRGEELITDRFPELALLASELPDGTVVDAELLPWKDGEALPFKALQTRIGRKNVTAALQKKAPIILMAYDLLEWEGRDIREWALEERRHQLKGLVERTASGYLCLSPSFEAQNWDELATERERQKGLGREGLMLKRYGTAYQVGRKRGDWWKWKVDPFVIDAVMIYAQRGHGRRANLYSDYTFAAWHGDQLVPFTKAYSGLTDQEMRQVDAFVKKNTVEKFGPVRSVKPELVFEIAFEGIQSSNRHKSGVALRFPRINRWRTDKPIEEANTLHDLHQLLAQVEGPPQPH